MRDFFPMGIVSSMAEGHVTCLSKVCLARTVFYAIADLFLLVAVFWWYGHKVT